ncbi:MAG: tetratricopeptide repeat protein, partial [Planctomycetota bacterium]
MRRPRGAFWQICVLASAFACVALSPPALGSPEQGRSDLRTANGLLNRGLHELAAEEYQSALDHLEDDARIAEARYGLAVCSFRLNELERTLEQLDAIPEIPEFAFVADAQALRGHALFGLQRWGDAADAFEALAREHSGHGSAAQGLAIAVEARNREGDHRAAVRSGRRFDALYERSGEHADISRRMRFFKADSLVRLG